MRAAVLAALAAVALGQASQPYRWSNVRIDGGGFVPAVLFSKLEKEVVYLRTDMGGIYSRNATTGVWKPLLDSLTTQNQTYEGILSLAIHPTVPGSLSIATGLYYGNQPTGAFLASADYGATWSVMPLGVHLGGNQDGRNAGERLAYDPNLPSTMLLGTSQSGLMRSTDGGASWTTVASFPATNTMFVVFDAASGTPGAATPRIWVGAQDGPAVYLSTDGGSTWTTPAGQPSGLISMRLAIDGAGDGFMTFGNALGPNGMTSGAVYKIAAGTGAWTNVTPKEGTGGGFCGVAIDAQVPGTVVVTTLDRWTPDAIYRSTDGGATWTNLVPSAVTTSPVKWINFGRDSPSWTGWMSDIAISPWDSSEATHTTGQGIWTSTDLTDADAGKPTTWVFTNQGIEETVPLELVAPASGPVILYSALGDIDGFPHTSLQEPAPGGMYLPAKGTSQWVDVAFGNTSVVVRTTGSSDGWIAFDGGYNFTGFPTSPNGARAGPIAISTDASTVLWSGSISTDFGATWTPCAGGLPRGAVPLADRVAPRTFYALGGGALWASTDGGATFKQGAAVPGGGGGTPRAVFSAQGHVWVPAGTSGLFRTKDGGATLTQVAAGVVTNAVAVGVGAPCPTCAYPAIFVQGDVGGTRAAFFRSDDEGATWVRINDAGTGFGYVMYIVGDPRVYGRCYLGTNGRGIPYGEIAA